MGRYIAISAETLSHWWGINQPDALMQVAHAQDREAYARHVTGLISTYVESPTADQGRAETKNILDGFLDAIQVACKASLKYQWDVASHLLDTVDQCRLQQALNIASYRSRYQEQDDEVWIIPSMLLTRWAEACSYAEFELAAQEARSDLDGQWFCCVLGEDDRNSFEIIEDAIGLKAALVDANYLAVIRRATELLIKIDEINSNEFFDVMQRDSCKK